MKKIKSKFGLMALLVACMLTACSEGNDESMADMQMNNAKADVQSAVFEGEWTIDKEVVDTARLEVSSVLKLRLPATRARQISPPSSPQPKTTTG